ncbi:hypothetical protein GJ496_003396 [Pomphorhynchus laevis]|nr:hypothetical protein GJ496_003396 [Pomphorhynchus laevis]
MDLITNNASNVQRFVSKPNCSEGSRHSKNSMRRRVTTKDKECNTSTRTNITNIVLFLIQDLSNTLFSRFRNREDTGHALEKNPLDESI